MRDTKHESPRDGTLRIHRRRAGTYQPKDSLGLSCILQGSDPNDEGGKLLTRRRTLTAPQDNIGISCLPSKDSSRFSNKSDLELGISELASIKDIVLGQEKKTILEDLWKGNEAEKQKKEISNPTSIGISNIRRPRNDSTKTRKLILPKDNIGHCCRLLQKPTASTTSIKSLEKGSKLHAKPVACGTNLKAKQNKNNSKGS